jgi:hypothetical protein
MEEQMAHVIFAVDTDKLQHEKLVRAINERKYQFSGTREGYTRPIVSEIRFYDVRMKKEIVPFFMQDLGAGNLFPADKIKFMDAIRNPKEDSGKPTAFFSGRIQGMAKYFIQRIGKFLRFKPLPVSKSKDRVRQPFVNGHYYPFAFGQIEDIDRGHGEEL